MNLTNRQTTLFALSRSIGWTAVVTGALSLGQTVYASSAGDIDHTPRIISEGKASKVGHLDPVLKMRLTLVLDPPFQDELNQLNKDLQDPQSPKFHRFLTLAQVKARYAPPDDAVQAVIALGRGEWVDADSPVRKQSGGGDGWGCTIRRKGAQGDPQ
jgi:hypothetical protein